MSVQAVNSVNNIQQKPVQSPIEPQKSEQKESIANGTTLLLGSLAALAIGTGIYFATKGRGTSGTSSATGSSSTVNQIKEYTAKAFTDAGNKFEKGVAKLKNGENYTGTITHTTKDGKFVVREYENGLIKKSAMYECENAEKLDCALWRKEYKYDKGVLNSIQDNNGVYKFQKNITDKYIDTSKYRKMNSGELIIKLEDGRKVYDKGILKFFSDYSESTIKKYIYYPNGKVRYSYTSTLKDPIITHFDENGNVIWKRNCNNNDKETPAILDIFDSYTEFSSAIL